MTVHLLREINVLKESLLLLGARVEHGVQHAVEAVSTLSPELAQVIIEEDAEIDQMEIEIEEDCLKILALHQPVAIDLRFIIAALKINSDLERIGDLSANIARQTLQLVNEGSSSPAEAPFDYQEMTVRVQEMLRQSIEALVNLDAEAARRVCAADVEVDLIHQAMYETAKTSIQANPARTGRVIAYMIVARHLERIADHATNIAEDVIYMIDGTIVRHCAKPSRPVPSGVR